MTGTNDSGVVSGQWSVVRGQCWGIVGNEPLGLK